MKHQVNPIRVSMPYSLHAIAYWGIGDKIHITVDTFHCFLSIFTLPLAISCFFYDELYDLFENINF